MTAYQLTPGLTGALGEPRCCNLLIYPKSGFRLSEPKQEALQRFRERQVDYLNEGEQLIGYRARADQEK